MSLDPRAVAAQRVHVGAIKLDQLLPQGWWENVDEGRLDMWSTDKCVAGQLATWLNFVPEVAPDDTPPDGYYAFQNAYGIDYNTAVEWGLDVRFDGVEYKYLDEAWLAEIAKRKAQT